MSALIDGIFKEGEPDQALRLRLHQMARRKGASYIYKRLQRVDADAACRIHPHDTKRIIRALEVYQGTGKPISRLQKKRKGIADLYSIRSFCLDLRRGQLYQRIGERLEGMFRDGLVNEVKGLLKKKLSRTARYAIGIRELENFFCGRRDLEEAKELIMRHTRNYAKRQISWFRRDKRIQWIKISNDQKPKEIARRICQMIPGLMERKRT